MNSETKRKIGFWSDIVLFLAFLAVMSVLLWRLVICQAIYAERSDGYPSDILAYMQTIQGIESGYDFPYPLFFSLGRLFNMFMPIGSAVALAETLLNGISIIALKYWFESEVKRRGIGDKPYIHLLVTLLVAGCFFMSMWWLPRFGRFTLPFKDQVYVGTFTGNPWHNATYLATRPFAIICFFAFLDVLREYEEKLTLRHALVFAVSLLLTTLAKPSFTLVFLTAAGLVWVFRLIRSGFKNIKGSLLALACIVPTIPVLLYQFGGVFGSGNTEEVHGLGFSFFEVWKGHNSHVIAAVIYANVFSLVCLVFMFKELKDETFRFGAFFFLISFLEAGLLCEKGKRFTHFNFCWGYMHGIFFFQSVSLILLTEMTIRKGRKPLPLILMWLAFLSQVVAGVLYFRGVYFGLDYKTLLPATWVY